MSKKVFGWAMYDFANTVFSALFITLFFPLLIKNILGGTEFHVGLVMGISFLLAGIFVPFFGAFVDARGKKKQTLLIVTSLCIVITPFVGWGNLTTAIVLGVLATFFYHACIDVYDAMLTDVSNAKNRGRVSGIGTAFGYVGSLTSIAIAYGVMSFLGWNSDYAVKVMFSVIGVLFFGFALVSFWLMEDKKSKPKPLGTCLSQAFYEIKHTFTDFSKYKTVFLFLLCSFLFTDGMNIVIVFFFLFAQETINLGFQDFFFIFGAMAIASGIGSILFGKLTDRIGPKKTLLITQILWVFVITVMMVYPTFYSLLIVGSLGAAALGGVWTATRPMLIEIAPKKKLAEFFGFQGLTEKVSGGLGPFVFGIVAASVGYNVALLIPLISFIAAFLILLKIKE